MKNYKKLALIVACFAISETMPAEKPAPDPSIVALNNDYCLAALELASMLTPKSDKENLFSDKQKLSTTEENAAALKIQSDYKQNTAKKERLEKEETERIAQEAASLARTKSDNDFEEMLLNTEKTQHQQNIKHLANQLFFDEHGINFNFINIQDLTEKLHSLSEDEIIPITHYRNFQNIKNYSVKEIRIALQNTKQKNIDFLINNLCFKNQNIIFNDKELDATFRAKLNILNNSETIDIRYCDDDSKKTKTCTIEEIRTELSTLQKNKFQKLQELHELKKNPKK